MPNAQWVSVGVMCPDATVLPSGLQNDHKAVMKQVEEALHQLHAHDKEKQARDLAEAHREAMGHRMSHNEGRSLPQAFARVNSVSPGSPASVAVSQPSPRPQPGRSTVAGQAVGSRPCLSVLQL